MQPFLQLFDNAYGFIKNTTFGKTFAKAAAQK
jgi:hypothetical protein